MASIEQARKEVDRRMQEAIGLAEGAEKNASTVEALLWTSLLGVGRALVALFFARRASSWTGAIYEFEGLSYEVVGRERARIGTRFGKVEYERPVGRVVHAA